MINDEHTLRTLLSVGCNLVTLGLFVYNLECLEHIFIRTISNIQTICYFNNIFIYFFVIKAFIRNWSSISSTIFVSWKMSLNRISCCFKSNQIASRKDRPKRATSILWIVTMKSVIIFERPSHLFNSSKRFFLVSADVFLKSFKCNSHSNEYSGAYISSIFFSWCHWLPSMIYHNIIEILARLFCMLF